MDYLSGFAWNTAGYFTLWQVAYGESYHEGSEHSRRTVILPIADRIIRKDESDLATSKVSTVIGAIILALGCIVLITATASNHVFSLWIGISFFLSGLLVTGVGGHLWQRYAQRLLDDQTKPMNQMRDRLTEDVILMEARLSGRLRN